VLGCLALVWGEGALEQNLLKSYFASIYELPTASGLIRASLDGDMGVVEKALPELLLQPFALLSAYNPRSMLLPRRVNEQRQTVMRDLLVLGCYRVEGALGFEEEPDGTWREAVWLVHGMPRDEAIAFGRVFRQNTVIVCEDGRPELVVTDPTCDDVGRGFRGFWRPR
jgi:Protein of unknown function (DUF3293)